MGEAPTHIPRNSPERGWRRHGPEIASRQVCFATSGSFPAHARPCSSSAAPAHHETTAESGAGPVTALSNQLRGPGRECQDGLGSYAHGAMTQCVVLGAADYNNPGAGLTPAAEPARVAALGAPEQPREGRALTSRCHGCHTLSPVPPIKGKHTYYPQISSHTCAYTCDTRDTRDSSGITTLSRHASVFRCP